MPKTLEFSVASFAAEPAAKAAARIVVSQDSLLQLTGALENDRLCVVEGVGAAAADGQAPVRREASLWHTREPLKKSAARVSRAFREAAGLSAKDKIRITVPDDDGDGGEDGGRLPAAVDVVVEDVVAANREGGASAAAAAAVPLTASAEPALVRSWTTVLEDQLDLAEVVFPGMVVRDVYHRRTRRTFRVQTVNGRRDSAARFVVDATVVRFADTAAEPGPAADGSGVATPLPSAPSTPSAPQTPRTPRHAVLPLRSAAKAFAAAGGGGGRETGASSPGPSRDRLEERTLASPSPAPRPAAAAAAAAAATAARPPPGPLHLEPIDGLDGIVEELNDFFTFFGTDAAAIPSVYPCAAVLQGDEGTGKTLLLDRVAATGWGPVFAVQPTDKLSEIQETLQKAAGQRPSIVTLDNIQDILPEARSNRPAVVKALCDFLDEHAGPQSTAGSAAPRPLVLATCLDYLKDIPAALRRPGRLSEVIRIPFPDPARRRAILRSFEMRLPPDAGQAEALIKSLSHQTHAFNGHDLRRLYIRAYSKQARRLRLAKDKNNGGGGTVEEVAHLTEHDFKLARSEVGPTRMDGIDIKPRPVYWRDIHGQQELVQALQERVDMMHHPGRYAGLCKPFPRGFLLYGPPGCSKTMVAQALATESELNYFAVKGGELLNQYVGETERATRELFSRARRAAPAVIFLDEIDALGGRRADFGDKSAASGRGPQMVPALLTELDGFEPLDNVIVIGATNRPEALDPALLRMGRFDTHLYVPPPNEAARRAIFAGWTAGMRVSADLDLDRLAQQAHGLSGAEILGICQKVGSRTNRAFQAGLGPDEITTAAFEAEIARAPRTITRAMLDHFERWTPSYQ